jgi:ATP-dependent DNA ligase
MKLEGIVSKRADAAYAPGNRGLWLKVKCLHREEFVVIGWTDPEGTRPFLGALLLGYYDPGGRLVYAGRVGTGIDIAELERLWRRLQPLSTSAMPLDISPPRSTRFGSPLVLSRVHWVRPELVTEVKFLAWTEDNLLRHVVYEGVRDDKPAREVRRDIPHPRPGPRRRERATAKIARPLIFNPVPPRLPESAVRPIRHENKLRSRPRSRRYGVAGRARLRTEPMLACGLQSP